MIDCEDFFIERERESGGQAAHDERRLEYAEVDTKDGGAGALTSRMQHPCDAPLRV